METASGAPDPCRLRNTGWWHPLVFTCVAAGLTIAAGGVMFSAFMFYDDEGYVLMSLRNFAEHGRLYEDVFSQYGPFPFVFHHALQAVGLPLTHTAGRLLTLAAWSGAALACAAIVGRATGSLAARLAVLASVFVFLWVMASEPSHPGGLITIVTALLAWLGHHWISAGRERAWAALAGAGTAALLLTKVNVGVFAGCSAAAWLLLNFENPTVRRWAPAFLAAGIVVLPFALMRPLLDTPWAQTFAVMFACAGLSTVGAAALGTTQRADTGTIWAAILGALTAASVIVVVVFARGTTAAGLLEGVLLRPLRHPVHFNLTFVWPPAAGSFAVAGLISFGAAWWLRRKGLVAVDTAVAIVRVVGALALAAAIARFPTISPDAPVLAFSMPWLWAFVWPLANEPANAIAARRWVGLLFLGQCLHAFPVPGSQVAWGTFLAIPVAALGAWSAAMWLARPDRCGTGILPVDGAKRRPDHGMEAHVTPNSTGETAVPPRTVATIQRRTRPDMAPRNSSRWLRRMLPAIVGTFALFVAVRLAQVGARYRDGNALNLPGAELLRLPEHTSALYQLLALNAVAHADMLFSLPGMFSFNLWTGVPPPTLANVTHWFSLLDASQQQAIITALEAHPRACVIVQRGHLDFLAKRGFSPAGPLHDYVTRMFEPAFVIDDFEFCVRRGRKIEPLLLGEMITGAGEPKPADDHNTMFTLNVLLPAARSVASVEIASVNGPPLVLDASSARIEITPTNLRGEPLGRPQVTSWPIGLTGPARIAIYFNRLNRPQPVRGGLIVFRDSMGEEVSLARLQP